MARSRRRTSRLLDQVAGDVSKYGPVLGLLATTFELDPVFFETDFLPTTLGLGGWDDRTLHSLVARERRLAQMDAAALFVQGQRYRGRPNTLRVDVRPTAPGAGRRLHAKIVLLVQRDRVRLLVTSANLTEPGYRLNREVGLTLHASSERPQQAPLILDGLAPLPKLLGPHWNRAAAAALAAARERLEDWGHDAPRPQDAWVAWGGSSQPLWEQFLERWPKGEPVEAIQIVSPFWSEERGDGPVARLLGTLRDRNALGDKAQLTLHTEARAERAAGGEVVYHPVLPASYGETAFSELGVDAFAEPVCPRVSPEELDAREETLRERPLHAKVVLLHGPRTTLAYAGSANFTRSGWGLGKSPSAANIEAGVILRARGEDRQALRALVPPLSGHRVPLTGRARGELVEATPEPEPDPWPGFLTGLELAPTNHDPDALELVAHVTPSAVAGPWELLEPATGDPPVLLASTGERPPEGRSEPPRVPLSPDQLRLLMRARHVQVRWWASETTREFPVNVAHAARLQLPLSPSDPRLGEDLLLSYYQGRVSFEELFADPSDEATPSAVEGDPSAAAAALAPVVDTGQIQSYQVRAFVEALVGVREDIRAAAQSGPYIRLALLGPVSPVALAREVARAVGAGQRTPVAGAFELVELRVCLLQARGHRVPNDLAEAWRSGLDEADRRVAALLQELVEQHEEQIPASFRRYESKISRHHGACPALPAAAGSSRGSKEALP